MVNLFRPVFSTDAFWCGWRSPLRHVLLAAAALGTSLASAAPAQTTPPTPDVAVQTEVTPAPTAPPMAPSSPFTESLLHPPSLPAPDFVDPLIEEPLVEDLPLRITIDLSDRRLTLYRGDTVLHTYPVAVGREGWQTPTGEFEVRQMVQDPTWMNPFTREVIDGGHPRNPLGRYWIGFWTDGTNWVGMHGTPNPETVGTAASHGCIRLYNDDIQALFGQVTMGTPVTVVP